MHDAVRLNREEAGEERAARSRDDLRDAGRIGLAGRILRCEALIPVHVPGHIQIRVTVVSKTEPNQVQET